MKYWMIVKSGINRKKIRTFMTVFSIATAFLLFSLGRSVAVAFNSEVDFAGKDRLIVVSRLAFTESLPMAHKNRIEAIEGVETVVWRQWFGGTYKERQNFFPKWPVPDNYFDVYPEWELSEGAQEAFSQNITGMIVGDPWPEATFGMLHGFTPVRALAVFIFVTTLETIQRFVLAYVVN